jgi:hypothetical protein
MRRGPNKTSTRNAMHIGIMVSALLHTFTIAAASVVSSPQASVKYVILDHKTYSATSPANSRVTKDQEKSGSRIIKKEYLRRRNTWYRGNSDVNCGWEDISQSQ